MNHPRRFSSNLLLAFGLVILAGCGSSPAARFYLLSPTAQASAPAADPAPAATANSPSVTLAVGPVDLPSYLDRPQMARRVDDNRMEFAEFDRWAEPLKENLSRVFVENLAALLPAANVRSFPMRGSAPPAEYQVAMDIRRFEAAPGNLALLEARFTITKGETGELLASRTVRLSEPFEKKRWDSVVAAQSRCLELLSREVATAIQELQKTAKPQ